MADERMKLKAACGAAGVVLAVLAGVVLHGYLVSSRKSALAAVEAEFDRLAEANVAGDRAVRDLPRLRSEVGRLARRVPPDTDLGPLLGSVGSDATGAAPEREIVSKPTVKGQPVARVPFQLQYRGSFASTLTLLRRLHDGPLLTQVERVVVESEPAGEGDKPLRVQVEFSTFARTSKELEAWSQAE